MLVFCRYINCISSTYNIFDFFLQVVGDMSAVKNAISIISSRLRESQHRDRSHFHGRVHSPERFFPDDDCIPQMNNTGRRTSLDGPRFSGSNYRNNNYDPRPSIHSFEAVAAPISDSARPFFAEDLVFQMLCPIDKVHRVVGESEGIVELLQNEIGVDVKVADAVVGSDEQVIIISSDEVLVQSLYLCRIIDKQFLQKDQ